MKYKVIFNLPGKNEATEVLIENEKMGPLLEAINKKKVVQIGDGFYNTAYFVNAIPDKTVTKLSDEQQKQLQQTRQRYTAKQLQQNN